MAVAKRDLSGWRAHTAGRGQSQGEQLPAETRGAYFRKPTHTEEAQKWYHLAVPIPGPEQGLKCKSGIRKRPLFFPFAVCLSDFGQAGEPKRQ